jgi:hypothetical protein
MTSCASTAKARSAGDGGFASTGLSQGNGRDEKDGRDTAMLINRPQVAAVPLGLVE